jgi:hypothetical protein
MKYIYSDGGRSVAGYKGNTRDCVVRAIAIATEKPYKEVYDALFEIAKSDKRAKGNQSPRNGVGRKYYDRYLKSLGWTWVPTMTLGSGCKVHLVDDELPMGRLIIRLSGHLTTVIDGCIFDIFNPQRSGIICENGIQRIYHRCVYGYYVKPSPKGVERLCLKDGYNLI